MSTYIAFFRGINVGGRNLLPMRDLVAVLQNLGCTDVRTYIQSGNAVFNWQAKNQPALIKKLQAGILDEHGFSPEVLMLKRAELERAIANNPFNTSEGKALHFFFFGSAIQALDLNRLTALRSDSEQFELQGQVLYLHAAQGIGRSKLAAAIGKHPRPSPTARNWNTVRRLREMMG